MYILKAAQALALFSFAEGIGMEDVKYDEFIGKWYSCLETNHMTFEGETQKKHTHQNTKCIGYEMAEMRYVGDDNGMDHTGMVKVTRILELTRHGLNHCEMWGLTGATCPNATLPNHGREEEQTVMYTQNFHGIGSYMNENHVQFYGEEKSYVAVDGSIIKGTYDSVEDQDFFDCTYEEDLDGLICDRRQNEYRPGMGTGDEWRPISYSDFGTHYLVQDMKKCGFCSSYECVDTNKRLKADILGFGVIKKVTCNNVNKIDEEATKKMICDTEAEVVGGNDNKGKAPIKDHCPNVCGICMDMF